MARAHHCVRVASAKSGSLVMCVRCVMISERCAVGLANRVSSLVAMSCSIRLCAVSSEVTRSLERM